MEALKLDTSFAKEIRQECGVDLLSCYQCKMCTSGCMVSDDMDYSPHAVIKMIQMGKRDEALSSSAIWLCASCETCTARCPQGIDFARAIDAMRAVSQREKRRPAVRNVPIFNKVAMYTIKKWGRMYEVGTTGGFNLLSGQPLKDIGLGAKLFMKGKLELLPSKSNYPKDLTTVKESKQAKEANTIAYFSGCALHSMGAELNMSSKAVAEKVGLKLEEPKDWVCCGATPAHSTSHLDATVLGIKNLALVERMGYDYLTVPCAACYSRFKTAAHDIGEDEKLKGEVAKEIGYEYGGSVKVENFVDTLFSKVGLDKVAENVEKKLSGLKAVSYYGCYLTRPPKVTGVKDPDDPTNMDELVGLTGATALNWSYKTKCCGGALGATMTDISLKMMEGILSDAKRVGADVIVTACPLCQVSLDLRQKAISRKWGEEYNFPVLYITQLLGLSFGSDPKELGLNKHITDPFKVLKERCVIA